MNEELMKVTNVSLKESDRISRVSGGVYIEYISSDNVVKDSYLKLTYKESTHYFQVSSIELDGKNLKISAREVGYYARKFDRMKDLDMRDLIGLEVIKVDDKESISKINEMSCWC